MSGQHHSLIDVAYSEHIAEPITGDHEASRLDILLGLHDHPFHSETELQLCRHTRNQVFV